jgi:NADH dehydrogenase [ubiquinone] 1 alpha subcomplex assembly factor 7
MLINFIEENILKNGYISIADFMNLISIQTEHSYYQNLVSIGTDFITSSEISQVFGEVLMSYILNETIEKNYNKINILELGAGTGKLAFDILSSFYKLNKDIEINYYIFDKSASLTKVQKERLSAFKNVYFLDNLLDLNDVSPCFTIANEFFDALPIKQYIKVKNTWHEYVVKFNHENMLVIDKIPIIHKLNEQFNEEHPNAFDGAVLEERDSVAHICQTLGNLYQDKNGKIIVIDYGYNIDKFKRKSTEYNSTLSAIRNHKYVNFLDCKDYVDISAHVDFHDLKEHMIVNKFDVSITTQGEFLKQNGAMERFEVLINNNQDIKQELINQLTRLTSAKYMGELFKVLIATK